MIPEDQSRITARLNRLAKRCAAVYWVRGFVYGLVASLMGASVLETVSALGVVEIPAAPWNLGFLLVPGAVFGLWFGWRRAPSVRRCLHELDRANGFADTLLLGYELGERQNPSRFLGEEGEGFEGYLWSEVNRSLDAVRGDTLSPWGAGMMAVWFGISLSLLGAAGTLATVGPSGLPARAMGSWLPESPVHVRGHASLNTPEDRQLITDLMEEIRAGLKHVEEGTQTRAILESLSEVAGALQNEKLTSAEALSRLERLKARVSHENGTDTEAEQDPVLRRFVEQARKELGAAAKKEGKGGEKSDNLILESLAEWAMTLAKRDPEAFQSLAERLARTLDGRTLSRLKDKHSALSKKFERLAKKLGSDPKRARRLKKLQSQLEALSDKIANKEQEPRSPKLDRLRKALRPEQGEKSSESGAEKGAAPQTREKKRGTSAANRQASGAKNKPRQATEKAEKVRSELKRLSGDMERRKRLRRVGERLKKTTERVRREVSARKAQERIRKLSKKNQSRSGAKKLTRKGSGSSSKSGGAGAKKSGSGSLGKPGLQPGTGHEKSERARRATKRISADYKDSLVSNEGKPGGYLREQFKGSATLGQGTEAGKILDSEKLLDDEVLKARIPSRYRETVRTYFRLLPELFSE